MSVWITPGFFNFCRYIPNESTQTGAFVLAASWDHNNGIFSGYKSFNPIKLSWSKLLMSKYIFNIPRLVILFEKLWFATPSIEILSGVVGNVPLSTVSQRLLVATVMASLEQLIYIN
jgi:hypothetical protein